MCFINQPITTKTLLYENKAVSCLIFLAPVISIFAQEKSKIKFGKITAEDFKQKIYEIDSSANAVIIADIGSTEIVGNNKGGFSLEFKTFRRAHILNKNGYDIANVEIPIYTDGKRRRRIDIAKSSIPIILKMEKWWKQSWM